MLLNKTIQRAEQRFVPLSGKESSLHRSLKFHYSGSEGDIETPVGDYVCDGRTSKGEIIEIQTGSFGPLKEKLKCLTKTSKVRVVHPIAKQKHIELYDSDGNLSRKRKSTRKGSIWDLFKVLIYAPELALQKNLIIELAIIDILEKRVNDGKGSWRRKGVSITDRSLEAWHSSILLSKLKDYYLFVPFKKSECFMVQDLAEKAGINANLARKTLYVLTKIGLTEKTGRQGNASIYRLVTGANKKRQGEETCLSSTQ